MPCCDRWFTRLGGADQLGYLDVFDIDPRSLHVFYDLEGPVIAFNRNGSLFFNLRYYLA